MRQRTGGRYTCVVGVQHTCAHKISFQHNAALKILFLEVAKIDNLVEASPLWFSQAQPKPVCKSEQLTAYWGVPVYADQFTGYKGEQSRHQVR